MFQLRGPNLERLWQSVVPGRYMASSLRVPYEDRSAWYYPSSWLPTKNMSREERQKYLNEHPVVYNMYIDGERYKQGKSLVNGIETLAKTAMAAAGKFVAKKTREWGIKKLQKMLLMGLKPQVHYMVQVLVA